MSVSIDEVWSKRGHPLGRLKRSVTVANNATYFRCQIMDRDGPLVIRDMEEMTMGPEVRVILFEVGFVQEIRLRSNPDNDHHEEYVHRHKVLFADDLRRALEYPDFIVDPDLDAVLLRQIGEASGNEAKKELAKLMQALAKLQEEAAVHREVRKNQRAKIKKYEKLLRSKGELGAMSNTPIQHTPRRVIQLGD